MILNAIKSTSEALSLLGQEGANLSFSQFGEDMALWSILETYRRLEGGFYVDIGAHHPWKYSNTALLHSTKNWRGINIDASSDAIALFNKYRPNDINLCAAISDVEELSEYAVFNHSGVNTLDAGMRERQVNASHGAFKLEKIVNIETKRLDKIFHEYLPTDEKITLMNIDVEGYDLKALKSNDWGSYRPFMVLVETHGMNLDSPATNDIYQFMKSIGYRFVSQCFVTSIFIDI